MRLNPSSFHRETDCLIFRCLLLELPAKASSGALQNATAVNELTTQIEGLRRSIQKVEQLLQTDRPGQEAMLSNIEKAKVAAKDIVTNAESVATFSASEQSDATVHLIEQSTTNDPVGAWLTDTSNPHGREIASDISTKSTLLESIFSDVGGSLISPTSNAESITPLPLRARGEAANSRDSRSSVTSDHSSLRRREFQADRDFSILLSNMGKWEKTAQVKLCSGDMAGAQQDLRKAPECRDDIPSVIADKRELAVLQKLVVVGGMHLELLQFDESELLFKYALERGMHISSDTSDLLRCEIVTKACATAVTKLESGTLLHFEKFSSIAQQHRAKITDAKLQARVFDGFGLQVVNKASEMIARILQTDGYDLRVCDRLCRIALQHGDHVFRPSASLQSVDLYQVQIFEVANEVIEENIGQRRFREAESLCDLLIEHGKRLPSQIVYAADLGRAYFNLAYSCYAQRTEEKLDRAEYVLSHTEEWQDAADAHLIHATNYLLAQTYWKKGNLDGAENCCWTAMKGRMDLFGDEHETYLEAVALFLRILRRKGKHREAELHAIQLTPEYCRKAATDWCDRHAYYESKDELLKRAINGGYQEAFNILLEKGVVREDLLRNAISNSDLKAAQMLLASDALKHGQFNHSSRQPMQDHPIALADDKGDGEMVTLLLRNASSIEDCAQTYDLDWAVREGRITAIQALLDLGARPDREIKTGKKILHVAAENGRLAPLQALLVPRPNLDTVDSDGATPLHVAVQKGHELTVGALLDAGADIEARKDTLTPLQLAISKQMTNLVQPLLDRGASPETKTENGMNAFHLAVMKDDKSTVRNLLTRNLGLLDTKTRDGRNGLHVALMSAGYGMARLLVDQGIDVNARTPKGKTAWDLSRRRESRDKAFEKLLSSKMSPKPSKIKARMNESLAAGWNVSFYYGMYH